MTVSEELRSVTGLPFPTSRQEDWKFTNLSRLAAMSFERPGPNGNIDAAVGLISRLPSPEQRLVFVDGCAAPELSTLPREFSFTPARPAGHHTHPFVALNTAMFRDGAYLRIPAGVVVEHPIHVIHISTTGMSHPRNLIIAGDRSQASLIETYLGTNSSVYFSNAVTEIVAGEDSIVDHCKLQLESTDAFHLATVQVEQGRGCLFRSHTVSFGATLARTEINAVLSEGADCTLNGLYMAGGNQHVDNRTSIDHARPHGSSRELYKGILDGHSSAVFNGRIIVRKDAQKTDAKQTNRNLVLSEDATINTKPELQIHADDVRCTHGATIGQLDKDAIFYLQSRGIGREAAREILTGAFAREIIDGIRVESLRSYLEGIIFHAVRH